MTLGIAHRLRIAQADAHKEESGQCDEDAWLRNHHAEKGRKKIGRRE